MTVFDEKYWSNHYIDGKTQWDTGKITIPLQFFFDKLENKNLQILIPGGGNGYEASYLHQLGFNQIHLLDFSPIPLRNFSEQHPTFPKDHLIQENFFAISGKYDLVIEQTFFCALHPSQRNDYARKVTEILKPGGRLVGLLFNDSFNSDQPPFGGSKEEYFSCFEPHLTIIKMEECYNSIPPRQGRELWIELVKE